MATYRKKINTLHIPIFLRFLTAGLLNTVAGLSVIYSAMYFFGANPVASNAIGYGFGLFVGYFLNKGWTFKFQDKKKNQFILYLVVVAISYALNIALVYISIRYSNINPYGAQLLGMISYTLAAYVGCRKIVFDTSFRPTKCP